MWSSQALTCAKQACWEGPADGIAGCIQHGQGLAHHAAQGCACIRVQAAVYAVPGQPELGQHAGLQRVRNVAYLTL
jgi:hypothetical protein